MAPHIVFGGGGIGGTPKSFTYTWDTPEKVSELLVTLKDLGLVEIDSAASYPPTNPWNTETLLGQTRSSWEADFVIDSKIAGHGPGPKLNDERIAASITKTLDLLGISKLRTIYSHFPDKATSVEDTAAAFDRQFKEGKFERLGLCNYDFELLSEYFDVCEAKGYVKPSVFQNMYNAVHRNDEKDIMPLLRKHNCVYYAYSPLGGGFLTGKVTHARDAKDDAALGRTRWQGESTLAHYPPLFDKPEMHDALRSLEATCQAAKPPISTTEASLRWLINHSALQDGDAIIVGASRVHQLEDNVSCARRGPLPEDIVKAVNEMWEAAKRKQHI